MESKLTFDVAGQIEVDGMIVPNTGDLFTVQVRGKLLTSGCQDRVLIEKIGEANILAQIDGTNLLKHLPESNIAEILASRFPEEKDMEDLIETLRGLV